MSDQQETAQTAQTAVQTTYHYGIWVSSNQPVCGVVNNNNVEYLNEETDGNSINLSYEESWREFYNGKTAEWEEENGDIFDSNPELEEEWQEEFNNLYDSSEETYLIGDWKKNDSGKYEEDTQEAKEGETKEGFAAIVSYSSMTTQVIWSKWVTKCALCSPCYAGQGDLDSEGDYLAYDFPLEMYGSMVRGDKDQSVLLSSLNLEVEEENEENSSTDTE